MPAPELLENLATAMHDLWRDGLSTDGWIVGSEYSEQARTHDALVPFAELKPEDRNEVMLLAQQWAGKIVVELDYPRGDDRPFTLDELFAGMPVGWSERVRNEPSEADFEDPDAEIGHVTGWTVAKDGSTVATIRVAWPDSNVTEHFPIMRELRRVS